MRPLPRRAPSIALLVAVIPGLAIAAQTFQRSGTATPKPKAAPSSAAAITAVPAQPAPGAVPAPPRVASAEEQALRAIREDAARRVDALARQAKQMPEGPARDALLKQGVEIKRDSQVRFLETKAAFARGRGNLAAARQIESVLATWRAPGPAGRAAVTAAGVPASPGGKGGRP